MNIASPPWLGRVAALAILMVPLAILYVGLVQPLLDSYAEDRQEIEQQQALLQRYRDAGAGVPALEAQLAALRRAPAGQNGFLRGANEVLVAAQLQDRLQRLVEASPASCSAGGCCEATLFVGREIAVEVETDIE